MKILGSILLPNADARNSNDYYVGLIRPALTKGKRVGYLRWIDELAFDEHMLYGKFHLSTSCACDC